MRRFENKRILVAVTGGIAAYKACDLIRMLYREGAVEVVAMMTPSAQSFITPLTIESLTRSYVYVNNLENTADGTPSHIALAQDMDGMIIIPASANTLSKLAHGMADNIVTTTAMTFTNKPVVVVPAMNTRMWQNPLVQKNVRLLKALDYITLVPPEVGDLACGEYGDGKLADLDTVLLYLYRALHPQRKLFKDKRVVVTAGGTQEPIDTVRYIGNRSSGKMGIAVADELFAMGADVLLLHTVPGLYRPYRIIRVETVEELARYTKRNFKEADGLVMAAAVSDFRVSDAQKAKTKGKIKKSDNLKLELVKTEDILGEVAPNKKEEQFAVGFAAESDHILLHAREKLERKQLDMVVANDISRQDIGFGSDENEVVLLFRDKERVDLPKASKFIIARQLLVHLYQKFLAKREDEPEAQETAVPEEKTSDSSE